MIDVSDIINDPDVAQPTPFTVVRQSGVYVNGVFTTTATNLYLDGTIQPMTSKEIASMPGGDSITGGIKVWSTTQLRVASKENSQIADEVVWRGERWKTERIRNFTENGYYRAECVQKSGGG